MKSLPEIEGRGANCSAYPQKAGVSGQVSRNPIWISWSEAA